jgi:D-arabinose 1-dehydrogenase-like Zn-dependent alcohol dehydrogenase
MRFLREGRSIAGNSKSATEQAPNTRAEIMPEAYERMLKSDVKYRFVIDMKTL